MEKGQCSISGDLALAKRICEELTRGNNSVLHEIAHLDPVFRKLAAWKTYDEVDPEDAVNDFWEKRLFWAGLSATTTAGMMRRSKLFERGAAQFPLGC